MKNGMIRKAISLCVSAMLVLSLLTGCTEKSGTPDEVPVLKEPTTTQTGTIMVEKREILSAEYIDVMAVPVSQKLNLSVGGTVTSIMVGVGDLVEEGQLLLVLDQKTLEDGIESRKAQYSALSSQYYYNEVAGEYAVKAAAARHTRAAEDKEKSEENLKKAQENKAAAETVLAEAQKAESERQAKAAEAAAESAAIEKSILEQENAYDAAVKTSETAVTAAKNTLSAAENELEAAQEALASAKADVPVKEAAMVKAEEELEKARTAYEEWIAQHQPEESSAGSADESDSSESSSGEEESSGGSNESSGSESSGESSTNSDPAGSESSDGEGLESSSADTGESSGEESSGGGSETGDEGNALQEELKKKEAAFQKAKDELEAAQSAVTSAENRIETAKTAISEAKETLTQAEADYQKAVLEQENGLELLAVQKELVDKEKETREAADQAAAEQAEAQIKALEDALAAAEKLIETENKNIESASHEIEMSEIELRQAQLDLSQAEEDHWQTLSQINTEIELMEAKLGQNELKAPFAGRVVQVCFYQGQYAGEYETLIILADESRLRFKGPSFNNTAMQGFVKMDIQIDGRTLDVSYIPYENDEYMKKTMNGESLPTWFELPGDQDGSRHQVAYGMTGTIRLYRGYRADALVVPRGCISSDEYGTYVYLDQDGQRMKTYVTLGLETTTYYEILDGLKEGDMLYDAE